MFNNSLNLCILAHLSTMLRTVGFILILFYSFSASAHEYFFSFAEIEVDEMNHKLEITLSATTHDVEMTLLSSGTSEKLSGNENDSLFLLKMQELICKGLIVGINSVTCQLELEGFEVQLNGITHFYLSGTFTDEAHSLMLRYDFLMDHFPQQQNKATVIKGAVKRTLEFLPSRKEIAVKISEF